MKNDHNFQPLEKEDPLKIARYLDDMMLVLIQNSDNDGYLSELAHWSALRTLRNAFSSFAETTNLIKPEGHGDR